MTIQPRFESMRGMDAVTGEDRLKIKENNEKGDSTPIKSIAIREIGKGKLESLKKKLLTAHHWKEIQLDGRPVLINIKSAAKACNLTPDEVKEFRKSDDAEAWILAKLAGSNSSTIAKGTEVMNQSLTNGLKGLGLKEGQSHEFSLVFDSANKTFKVGTEERPLKSDPLSNTQIKFSNARCVLQEGKVYVDFQEAKHVEGAKHPADIEYALRDIAQYAKRI